VLVPGIRHGPRVPTPLIRVGLAVGAIVGIIGSWAVFAPRPVTTDGPIAPYTDMTTVRSIAYIEPVDGRDHLMIRSAERGSEPVSVYSFDIAISGQHARGSVAPTADRLAVLHSGVSASARMTLLAFAGRDVIATTAEGRFDHLSKLAWSADGQRLAATRSATDADGVSLTTVVEINASTGAVRVVAEVPKALEVAPVGYSIDGERMFWVVVDNSGSNLWMERRGEVLRIGELSPGRTTDWSLSPDGARVAFVDILGASSRTYVGRTMTIANGAITTLPATGNQIGTVWRPGAVLPEFGGPGGTLQLSEPSDAAAFIRPEKWSPLGELIVATVFAAGADRYAPAEQAIELGGIDRRELITQTPGASFLGWVRDLPQPDAVVADMEIASWQ
jgi:hypothetical protein